MLRRFLHRTASRIALATATRRFDGAAGGRRWGSNPTFGQINAEVLAAAGPVRRRAAYYCHNNGWATSGREALVVNIVGDGIRPASMHPDPAMRKRLQAAWGRWTAKADAAGALDFYGIQAAAVRAMVQDGECFAHLVTTPDGQLRIRLVDAELVDLGDTRDLGNGGTVVGAVQFNAAGERTGYFVGDRDPASVFASTRPPTFVAAADMAHLFNPLAPGQVRGVSWFAPVLLRLMELDELEDAMLLQQKVAALHAGFIMDREGMPSPGAVVGHEPEVPSLEPGLMSRLPDGSDVKFSTPAQASDGVPFIGSQLRAVAAGLGIPTFLLTGNLAEANYGSLRAGLVQFRRRVSALQYGVVIHQLLRPVWERFITLAVLSGEIEAPDFESHMADYMAVEWYPPSPEWVDPLKDMEAEALAVANGFKSRRQVVAGQGYAVEDLDAEIAADREREAAAGLSFSNPVIPKEAAADANT